MLVMNDSLLMAIIDMNLCKNKSSQCTEGILVLHSTTSLCSPGVLVCGSSTVLSDPLIPQMGGASVFWAWQLQAITRHCDPNAIDQLFMVPTFSVIDLSPGSLHLLLASNG